MSYNKTIVDSFSVNIRISQSSKVMFIDALWLTNPDVYLKRMHQLYNTGAVQVYQTYMHVDASLRDMTAG